MRSAWTNAWCRYQLYFDLYTSIFSEYIYYRDTYFNKLSLYLCKSAVLNNNETPQRWRTVTGLSDIRIYTYKHLYRSDIHANMYLPTSFGAGVLAAASGKIPGSQNLKYFREVPNNFYQNASTLRGCNQRPSCACVLTNKLPHANDHLVEFENHLS